MLYKTLFKSLKITTIIQTGKRRPEQIPKKKKIGNNISNIVFVIIISGILNNEINEKGKNRKNYCFLYFHLLPRILLTFCVCHLLMSPLNDPFVENA